MIWAESLIGWSFPILQRGFRLVNQCWTNFVRINRNKIEYFLVFLNVIRSPSVVKLSPSRPCLSTSLERSRSIPKFNFLWLPVACWLFGLSKNLTFITLLQFQTRLIIRNQKYNFRLYVKVIFKMFFSGEKWKLRICLIFEEIFRRKWPMSKFKSGRYCLNLLFIGWSQT